jgi:hypothetical protein
MKLGTVARMAALAAVCGCVSVDEEAKKAVDALRTGNCAVAEKWSADLADDSFYSANLGHVEAGRVAMLAGKYSEGSRRFRAAVDSAVDRTEASPKLKMGDLANTAMASVVTDDRTREYYLPPYEINMALAYGIMTQLLEGRRDSALVDARLAVYVQDSFAGLYGSDVKKDPDGIDSQSKSIIDEQNAALESMIASTRNSWENPLLWWLTGVLFEADGDAGAAWQSYRKAAAIMPGCPFFAKDSSRADGHTTPRQGRAKLVVIYEQDFVPMRESLKVPVPIYTGFSIDIPKYGDSAIIPETVSVHNGTANSAAFAALDVRSLAARDLKDQLPGIIVRNITRAAAQAGAQASVNAAGNQYAQIAVFAGNMIVSAIRRADTRSWITLPAVQHVWCDDDMAAGCYELSVAVNGNVIPVKVTLAPGETRLVWVARTGNVFHGASANIGGRGSATADLKGKEIQYVVQ